MWSNDMKCKCMFLFPVKNLACKRLSNCLSTISWWVTRTKYSHITTWTKWLPCKWIPVPYAFFMKIILIWFADLCSQGFHRQWTLFKFIVWHWTENKHLPELVKIQFDATFIWVITTNCQLYSNISQILLLIQDMGVTNLTQRNHWVYVTDVPKYHSAGIWSTD